MFWIILSMTITLLTIMVASRFDFMASAFPLARRALLMVVDAVAAVGYCLYYDKKGVPILLGPRLVNNARPAIHLLMNEEGTQLMLRLYAYWNVEEIILSPEMANKISPPTLLGMPIAYITMDNESMLKEEFLNENAALREAILVLVSPDNQSPVADNRPRDMVEVCHKTFSQTVRLKRALPTEAPANEDRPEVADMTFMGEV